MSLTALAVLLHGTGDFSWMRWDIHPSILIGCSLLAVVYLAGVGPLRERFSLAERVPGRKVACFLAAVAIIFVALNGPIHDLSDNYLFSAHMVQHMLLMMIMPPLLLLGTPDWLIRPLLRRSGVYRGARLLTHPASAFAIYNVIFIGWHFPAMYDWALVNHDVHIAQHLLFMGAATLMWWPVVNPVPELSRIGSPMVMLYLFAFGLPMSIVSAFITMADSVLYEWYAYAPRIMGLSAIEDQQLGGVIMWVPGMIIYWTAVAVVFMRWMTREERADSREVPWGLARSG